MGMMKKSDAATSQQRRSQRVQRGTNRPSEESDQTSTYTPFPSIYKTEVSLSHAEFMLYTSFPFNVTVATTASATRSAIQSSDLRQKITALMTKQRNAKAIVSARMSLRPRKCVSGAPDRSELLVAWLGTNASLIGVLMVTLFKLRIRR